MVLPRKEVDTPSAVVQRIEVFLDFFPGYPESGPPLNRRGKAWKRRWFEGGYEPLLCQRR
jgi:hypothetical protein